MVDGIAVSDYERWTIHLHVQTCMSLLIVLCVKITFSSKTFYGIPALPRPVQHPDRVFRHGVNTDRVEFRFLGSYMKINYLTR
jgi:hypothetical protein